MQVFIVFVTILFSTMAHADECLRDATLADLLAEVERRQVLTQTAYLDYTCPRDLEIETRNLGTGEIFRTTIGLPRSHHCGQVLESLTLAPFEIRGPRLVAGCYEWGDFNLVKIRVSPISEARLVSTTRFSTKEACEAEAASIN